jgi:ATP-dependent RNA helicase RhlE
MPLSIEKFARKILIEPKRVDVSPKNLTAHNIEERVMFVKKDNKKALLFELLKDRDVERAIVFTRTKHVAERLSKRLKKQNVSAEAIHGNKSQNQRQRSLDKFRDGKVRVLVATDVAARGIDVDEVSHVINYELSNEPESYVHRIGRTARAGNSGMALTLCDSAECELLADVERLLDREIIVHSDFDYHDADIAREHLNARNSKNRHRGNRNRAGNSRAHSRAHKGARPNRSRSRRRASA